jgi:hypothetical protein
VTVDYATADGSAMAAEDYLRAAADLRLEGHGPMQWATKKSRWKIDVTNIGGKPATVAVTGIEGSATAAVP